ERTVLDRHTWLPGAHPAVITPEQWDLYLARRSRQALLSSAQKSSPWPASGLAYCGVCGSRLVCASSARGRGYVYRCGRMQSTGTCRGVWITRKRVEAAILARLNELAEKLEAVAREAATELPHA